MAICAGGVRVSSVSERLVIPAEAGISCGKVAAISPETPAFAGVMVKE